MSSVCIHLGFSCAAQTTYLFFTKLKIEPGCPCLADEIAEQRPDMNIKVTALTESIKFYYTQCRHKKFELSQAGLFA